MYTKKNAGTKNGIILLGYTMMNFGLFFVYDLFSPRTRLSCYSYRILIANTQLTIQGGAVTPQPHTHTHRMTIESCSGQKSKSQKSVEENATKLILVGISVGRQASTRLHSNDDCNARGESHRII